MEIRGELKRRGRLRRLLAAIVLCGVGWSSPGGKAYAQVVVPTEEYRVYETALQLMDSIPKTDLHAVIYDRTLNGSCDGTSDIPVLANGCTFLWVNPDTAESVEKLLRTRMHGLSRSTWKTFKATNAASISLHDPLATPWKHRFTGKNSQPDGSKEWEAPDMTIFLSRVGFNAKKTEAIVYVLVFSYVGQAATSGDYLLFRSNQGTGESKRWSLAGRVKYFSGTDDTFVRLHPKSKEDLQSGRTAGAQFQNCNWLRSGK